VSVTRSTVEESLLCTRDVLCESVGITTVINAQELKKAEFVGGSIERAARGRVAMVG